MLLVYLSLVLAVALLPLVILLVAVSILQRRLWWAPLASGWELPAPLRGRHTDYLVWPLNHMPRSWTAFICEREPSQLLGTNPAGHHTDIPADGTWSLAWPFQFAIVSSSGLFFHIGIRFDYNDRYYNLTVNWPKRRK